MEYNGEAILKDIKPFEIAQNMAKNIINLDLSNIKLND